MLTTLKDGILPVSDPLLWSTSGLAACGSGSSTVFVTCICRRNATEGHFYMHGKSLRCLRRRIDALKGLQSRLLWPPISQFRAHGETYSLPYSPADERVHASESLLCYLAGFFDGDGCVSRNHRVFNLRVVQSCMHAEILVLFAEVFGGQIFRHSNGKGACRPSLVWKVAKGEDVRKAAAQLAERSFVKKQQLLLAAEQPSSTCTPEDQKHALAAAKKQEDHAALGCSWPFIAGFFDAEGCISLHPTRRRLCMSFSQNTDTVLRWIAAFWQHDMDSMPQLHHRADGVFELLVKRKHDVHVLLRRLLDNGLLTKRRRALLALGYGDISFLDIRHGLSLLSGNQGRYQKLTAEGTKRAERLASLQRSATYLGSAGMVEKSRERLEELTALRSQHEISNASDIYRILKSDIRQLLSRGAVPDDARLKKSLFVSVSVRACLCVGEMLIVTGIFSS